MIIIIIAKKNSNSYNYYYNYNDHNNNNNGDSSNNDDNNDSRVRTGVLWIHASFFNIHVVNYHPIFHGTEMSSRPQSPGI